jgi:hypothetical protein
MQKLIYGLFIFLFLGCATPEQRAEKIAVTSEIKTSAPNVKVVRPGDKAWCETESSCEYLRNLKCGTASADICIEHFQLDAVRLGGDTVVIQSFQEYIGQSGKIYSYAQAYNCSNQNSALGQRYQALNPTRLQRIKYLSKDYAQHCGTAQSCKQLEPFECQNFDWYPARRCLISLARQYTDAGPANVLVFEQETFTETDDNGKYQKGDYLVRGTAYLCNAR